jgi:hypothetical protein
LSGFYNGKFLIKFHLCVISLFGRWSLLIDATETSPLVRDDAKITDPTLHRVRGEVFEAGLQQIRALGKKMGNLPVFVESFSNTAWVREKYWRLPPKAVYLPTDLQDGLIVDAVDNFLAANSVGVGSQALSRPAKLHIQANALTLYEQGLRPNYKILYILEGAEPDQTLPYRGV